MHSTIAACVVALGFAPVAFSQVSGTVVETGSGLPVAGAIVRVQTTETATTTAADGTFSLPGVTGTVVLAAAKFGSWNGSVTVTAPNTTATISLMTLPPGDDPSVHFTSSANCNFCHQNVYSDWFQSPMAHGGENTWTIDLFNGLGTPHGMSGFVYTRDSKHKTGNPDGDCASCHAPVLAAQGNGAETPMMDLANATSEQLAGVACDLCHRLESVDLAYKDFPGVHPNKAKFRRLPLGSPPVMFGPWDDAVFTAGAMRPAYNPLFEGAQICALCHEDRNDHDDDGDYSDPGSIPHQSTYSEWLASPYAVPGPAFQDCKDCHMAPSGDTKVCVFGPDRDPSTIRAHTFLGTDEQSLQNAVELDLRAVRKNGKIVATVKLTNTKAGHAVPTGSDFRNLVLLVEATDSNDSELGQVGGDVVNILGGVGDPAVGDYAGEAGKLYGKINYDGQYPAQFFTEAVALLADNRLFPFQPDVTTYEFAAPPTGAVRVRARLVYRRAWRWLDLAKRWTYDGHGNPNLDLLAPHFGTLMEEARVLVKGP